MKKITFLSKMRLLLLFIVDDRGQELILSDDLTELFVQLGVGRLQRVQLGQLILQRGQLSVHRFVQLIQLRVKLHAVILHVFTSEGQRVAVVLVVVVIR